MPDIPDGLDDMGIRMAIAWEIAKAGFAYSRPKHGGRAEDPEGIVEIYTDLYNRAYFGLMKEPKAADKR